MADDIDVKFGAQIGDLVDGTNKVKSEIESLRASTDSLTEAAKGLAEGFLGAFTVGKIVEFIARMGDLGGQTERTMAALGLTARQVGEFSYFAKASGISLEAMTGSLERMTLNIQRSQTDAFNPAALALQKLGLSARELAGQPIEAQFNKIADAASRFNADISLTNVLSAIGGRQMAALVPLFGKGAQEIDRLRQKSNDYAQTLQSGALRLAETDGKLTELSMSVQALGIRIFNTLQPAINTGIDAITKFVQSIDAPKITAAVNTITGAVATGISAIGRFAIGVMALIDEATEKTSAFASRASAAAGGAAGGAIAGSLFFGIGALPGAITGGLAGWFGSQYLEGDSAAADGNKRLEARREQLQAIIQSFRDTMSGLTAGLGSAAGGESGTVKPSAGQIGFVNRDQVAADMRAIDGEIQVLRQGFAQKQMLLDADVQYFRITQNEKFALLQAETEKEYQAEIELLQSKLQIGGLSVSQRQQINNQILQLQAKHNTDMLHLDQQSIQAMTQQWNSLFTTIRGAWDSNWNGLLTGTITPLQALKNTFLSLTVTVIEYFEKMGLEWAAMQLGMTTAAQTGAAARAATEAAGRTAGQATSYADSIAAITRNAAIVFGGVFANLAPVMGPLAAGPAAASQASVMATIAEVPPPLEVGAWNIPGTMTATLHKGETVLPAPFAEAFRQNGGGFGGGITIAPNISAWDARSVQKWLSAGGARQLAREIARHLNLNPDDRPAF